MKRILVSSGLIISGLMLWNIAMVLNYKPFTSEPPSTYAKTVEKNATTDQLEVISGDITLTFVGDIMADRYIRDLAENRKKDYDYIFSDVSDLFNSSTAVIGNLEGSITSFDSVTTYDPSDPNHYRFTFDPLFVESLSKANISILSLDNNHSLDFGRNGYTQTRQYLSAANLDHFGNPFDKEAVLIKDFGEITIAFISYNQFLYPNITKTLEIIEKTEDKADVIIVYPHWGEEYIEKPSDEQRSLAYKMVDAGADLIVGAHPHVIQRKESYGGAPIYYSLGNFLFDQYFSDEVRCGLVLHVTISSSGEIRDIAEEFSYLEKDGSVSLRKCKSHVATIK